MKVDCLIVGQGIAGSVLAFVLQQQGLNVLVMDDDHRSQCSMIAAGLWNPVSFKHLHLTWRFPEFREAALSCYQSMEKVLGTSIVHHQDITRIFPDVHSANDWDVRSLLPDLAPYLQHEVDEEVRDQCIQPYGHGIVKGAGWIDVPTMLGAIKSWLISQGRFRSQRFAHQDLVPLENGYSYGDIQAGSVILATGMLNTENPWFGHLPVLPLKGEILTVELPGKQFSRILNYGHFLLRMKDHVYRLGSTYERNPASEDPSTEARDLFLSTLEELAPGQLRVLDHKSAYRPTTLDRKPLIGRHPQHERLFIFNGLGSKGVFLAPLHASWLSEAIRGKGSVHKEVDVIRYFKF